MGHIQTHSEPDNQSTKVCQSQVEKDRSECLTTHLLFS
ncbi:hypothetical protein EMIT048CA2_80140 [Pseudomonas chlororaphis]